MPRRITMIAVVAALATLLADLLAAAIGIASTVERGLTFRTALVIFALYLVASRAAATTDRRQSGGLIPAAETAGLILGWALNPLAWQGRAFIGQWFSDHLAMMIAIDFFGWVLAATAASALATRRAESARLVRR